MKEFPMKAIVIVPTYNEAEGILTMLDAALAAADVDILVVDDSSPDGTARLVTAHPEYGHRLHLLSRTRKEGLGAAYRAGFAWALAASYEAIVQMDADLSHPPARLPALLSALENADVAVGSRYVRGGGVRDWPLSRRAISRGGNIYVRLVLRIPVHDVTAGFKAFRREALERIGAVHSESNGYCFQIENTWRASRLGLRIAEVPITFTDRAVGTSKMTGDIVREAMLRVLTWRWRELATGGDVAAPGVARGASPCEGRHDVAV
jgi:dolichol-phosphate mannosyltransferase